MSGTGYRAPSGEARAELREKGSRFVALICPAGEAADTKSRLAELERQHSGATHLCWAWRLGWPPRERWSDAGEPRGTAGMPMLRVLRGAGLSDTLAAVARWFGGTKLGKGGLARAYAGAVKAALEELPTEPRRPAVLLELELPIERTGAIRRLVRPPAIRILEESYADTARLVLRVDREREADLLEALAALGASARRTVT